MTIKAPVTITLGEPLKAADGSAITTLTLRKPNVAALRGLQLALVQLQDVSSIAKLLPRITEPALSPDQVDALDPGDFAALANRVSVFFMTAEQASAVQTMT